MKKLHFSYHMQIDYSEPVGRCHFTIKCLPESTARQRIENVKLRLCPETSFFYGRDGFQNAQIYGVNEMPHASFRFEISGEAVTGLAPYEASMNEDLDLVFKYPYGLSKAGPKIREFYEHLNPEGDACEKALSVMHALYQTFEYRSCTTHVKTSAEEAFAQGFGVCQDYAHIFIALMHLAGIPARYVTGLLIGEGASHAWTEILHEGRWIGLDPTNDCMVSEDHIKIGVGRDAGDCMINRGIMHSFCSQTQTILACVTEQ